MSCFCFDLCLVYLFCGVARGCDDSKEMKDLFEVLMKLWAFFSEKYISTQHFVCNLNGCVDSLKSVHRLLMRLRAHDAIVSKLGFCIYHCGEKSMGHHAPALKLPLQVRTALLLLQFESQHFKQSYILFCLLLLFHIMSYVWLSISTPPISVCIDYYSCSHLKFIGCKMCNSHILDTNEWFLERLCFKSLAHW